MEDSDYAMMAIKYLHMLTFAEMPEKFMQSGQFDASRFRYSKESLKTALAHVLEFYAKVLEHRIDLSQFPADEIGHNFALSRNGHGSGFFDYNKMDNTVGEQCQELAGAMGPVDLIFRKRGDKIVVTLESA